MLLYCFNRFLVQSEYVLRVYIALQDDNTPIDSKYDIDGKYAPKVIFQGMINDDYDDYDDSKYDYQG